MRSVLYIDDEEALLDIAQIFLEQDGDLTVETCSNPAIALDWITTKKYEVIVTDYEMPLLNGIDLLKSIKARGIDTPVILFTGRGREIVAIEALNNGAAFYIQKGGDPKAQFAELRNMIHRAAEHKQAERRLMLTQFSVDRASDEIFWIDRSGKVLFVNDAACTSKEYTPSELLSMTIFDINPDCTQFSWSQRFQENQKKGTLSYESIHKRKNGSTFPVEITSKNLTFEGNEYFFAFVRDISERKQNELELRDSNKQMAAMLEQIRASDASLASQLMELERQKQTLFESESHYREIFENAPLGVFNSTPYGKILKVNEEFARVLGYDSAEELKKIVNRSTVQEALYEDPGIREAFVREVMGSGKWQHFENRYRKKDGAVITCHLIFRSFVNVKSGLRELEGFLDDISAQRKIVDTLQENEKRFRTLFEKVPVGYQSLDTDGRFIEVNKTWLETMGYSREEVIGHEFYEFLAPEYKERFQDNFPRFKEAGETTIELEMIKKEGSRLAVAFDGKIDYGQSGNIRQTHCIMQDITEHKRIFNQLKESEELFREVFNNANDSIVLHEIGPDGLPGRILMVNDIACRKTGYGRDELMNLSVINLVAPVSLPKLAEIAAQVREKGHVIFETTHQNKHGDRYPVELNEHIFRFHGKTVGLAIVRDISERNKSVTLIQHAMARTETLVRVASRLNASLDLSEVMNAVCEETAHALNVTVATLALCDPTRQAFIPSASYGISPEHRDIPPVIPTADYQKLFNNTRKVMILQFPDYIEDTQSISQEPRAPDYILAVTPMWREGEYVGSLVAVSLDTSHIFSKEDTIMLQAIADQAALAISNAQLFMERKKDAERIRETAARMETIIRVAARLNETLDPNKVMQGVCEEVATILHVPRVLLFLNNPEHQIFNLKANFGMPHEMRLLHPDFTLAEYETMFAGKERVVVLPDLIDKPDPPQGEQAMNAGVKTIMSAAIERKGDIVGVISVITLGSTRVFSEEDKALIRGVANETALALTNARLFSEQQKSEDAALQANKKLSILSNITRHDILNKLTVLLAYLELMKETVTDPKVAMYIQAQEKAAHAIKAQITFTKTYEDLGIRHPEWQNVTAIVQRIRSQLDLPGVTIDMGVDGVVLYADPLIEKVFYNLFDNAIRYGESVTKISVTIHQDPYGFTIICEDNGVGIPDNEKARIFLRGVGKNTGFGLFLVREILSITGMTITETGTYGKGARFEIQVPRENVQIVAAHE